MAKRTRKFETPIILPDLPLRESSAAHFHFDEFATTLARLIAEKRTLTPLTIGISGAWGSGKTSLLNCVRQKLDQTLVLLDKTKPAVLDYVNGDEVPQQQFRVCRTVWFNAWKYADEDELLVALVRVIVRAMADDNFVNKVIGKLLDPSYPRRDVVNTVLSWFSIKTGDATIGLNTGEPKATPFADKTAMLDLFNEAFDRLLAAWVHHKLDVDKIDPAEGVLVVFIDDLDRCLPQKTVQVLEAIKLFLDKTGCIFVLGADVEVVRSAVESYYKNTQVTGQNAADYLEKVIQLRVQLPPIVTDEMQKFLDTQGINQHMQNRWQALVAAAEVNPRRVKSVINDLELQWSMLVNSGQAAGVNRDDFICWQALMRAAAPSFRERFDGIPEDEQGKIFRYDEIMNALKWQCGDDEARAAVRPRFEAFEGKDSKRFRDVLKQIGHFSEEFTPETLNAHVHLVAPQKAEPAVRQARTPVEVVEKLAKLEEEKPAVRGKVDTRLADATLDATGKARAGIETFGNIEFVSIPKGRFIMGSKDDNEYAGSNEKPQHTVDIPYDFYMARFPITNEQYAQFAGEKVKMPKGKQNHPVVEVSWNDAQKYVVWLNENHATDLPKGYTYRLPSEAEWEKAARGEYGNEWPWGNEFDPAKCNADEGSKGGTTPVDVYLQGASPYGVLDMVGNVWEWMHTLFKEYPYTADDGREKEKDSGSRVLRGGSWNRNRYLARCACRNGNVPDYFLNLIGFRLVLSPSFTSAL